MSSVTRVPKKSGRSSLKTSSPVQRLGCRETLIVNQNAASQVQEVAAEDMASFFSSEAATKQRGEPRAAASVAQLRGIVRAAFAWWNQQGHTERHNGAALRAGSRAFLAMTGGRPAMDYASRGEAAGHVHVTESRRGTSSCGGHGHFRR